MYRLYIIIAFLQQLASVIYVAIAAESKKDKIIWSLICCFFGFFGAGAFYFVNKKK